MRPAFVVPMLCGMLTFTLGAAGSGADSHDSRCGRDRCAHDAGDDDDHHHRPPPPLPPPTTVPGGVGQVIAVSVRPGSLRVTPASMRVALERVSGDHYRGRLPTIAVVDARGNLAGWTLYLAPVSAHVELRVEPEAPKVVDGLPDGLGPGRDNFGERDRDDDGEDGHRVSTPAALCHARAPGGAGTYSCSGTIDVSFDDGRPTGGATTITVNAFVR